MSVMSKRDLKKEHILCAGLEVMKTCGYNGTSVKDIVDAAGVPKGSFYNYFESKETFAVASLEYCAADGLETMRRQLSASGLTPAERLMEFFSTQVGDCCESEFKVGCFLGNMCQEMADNSDLIRTRVGKVLRQQTELVEGVLQEGKDKGHFNPRMDTRATAEFLLNAWQGAMLRMKAAKSREPLDAFLTQTRLLLELDA